LTFFCVFLSLFPEVLQFRIRLPGKVWTPFALGLGKRFARHLELLLLFRIDFRVHEVKFCNVFHDRGRDNKPGKPFVSG
jgi:hypothetical protein